MAGVLILINEPFQVGDRIRFGDYYGEVREIGLRSVRLVTLDDDLVPFHLPPKADHLRAREIVHDAVPSSRFLVYDTRYETQFASDVTEQALVAFREAGIEQACAL